jgi:hypothetical protein
MNERLHHCWHSAGELLDRLLELGLWLAAGYVMIYSFMGLSVDLESARPQSSPDVFSRRHFCSLSSILDDYAGGGFVEAAGSRIVAILHPAKAMAMATIGLSKFRKA